MSKKLLDLSKKVDTLTLEILKKINEVAESMNTPFFVVGAFARDMILFHYYSIETGRATADIDLAIQVPDWNIYEQLRKELIACGNFECDNKQAQRLIYKQICPVDIIPFGTISDINGSISWPPEHDIIMNTLGFGEAYNNSITVRLEEYPAFEIQFASLPGLALLKLISWNENQIRRSKDAHDLLLLMRTYIDAGNQERLWEEEVDLVVEDFDYVLAGSRLLGRDVAKILSKATKDVIVNILDKGANEQSSYKLVEGMLGIGADSSDFEEALQLLESFKAGILERY